MRAFWMALVAGTVLVACAKGPTAGPSLPAVPSAAEPGRPSTAGLPPGAIKHIVFIVQENRTFDNIYGGPNPFPSADAVSTGQTLTGSVPLQKVALGGGTDPNNYHLEWLWACNATSGPPFVVGGASPCRMNGLNVAASPAPGYTPPSTMSTLYSYVDYNDTKPYWDMARKYALGDHFFMGHNSESYTAHQYIFSGQSNDVVDAPIYPVGTDCSVLYVECVYTPWGCDAPANTTTFRLDPTTGQETATQTFPCFGPGSKLPSVSYPSLADRVGQKGLTWRLYSHSQCANINGLDVNGSTRYGGLWPSVVNMADCHTTTRSLFPTKVNTPNFRVPETTVLSDVAGSGATLANVTWVLPGPLSSDHPGVPLGKCGPQWVARVVNAIGASKYWKSTAIFVIWDDWGGFYDHVPPYVVRDQAGPGFRVPLLVISPYAKSGSVVHTNAEFATLLKFTESTFGLASLNATDATPYLNESQFASTFFDSTPRAFQKVTLPLSLCDLTKEPPAQSKSRWLHMIDDD